MKTPQIPRNTYPKILAAWLRRWKAWLKRQPKPPVPPTPAPPPPTPKPKPKPKPKPVQLEMYDDVNVSLIPVSAVAVAGYVDGKWPTYAQLVKKFPHVQHILSIAVFASDNAQALDVEPGDATIAEAAAWVKRQKSKGAKHPIVYTSLSWAQNLVNALASKGLVYGKDYRLWTAHYTFSPHLCSPKCGLGFKEIAHATQWTDKAGGKSLDESLCSAEFFS